MTTEIHEGANGTMKKAEVEPLGEIKEVVKKPADLCTAGEANGAVSKKSNGGCELLSVEEPEPLTIRGTQKNKGAVKTVEDEDDDEYSSEDEEGDDEDTREGEAEGDEDEDEEYVNDGEEDDGEEEEAEPPSKRRK